MLLLGIFAVVCICARRQHCPQRADCLIVLGARVHEDGHPSRSLEMRCRAAAEAYQRGIAPSIIVCGGQGRDEPHTEAQAMERCLRNMGVDAQAILQEDASANTVENLRNARTIMRRHQMNLAAVVTSDYHLTRALWIARDLGVNAVGISAQGPLSAAHILKSRAKETASWVKYFFHKSVQREGRA